MKKLTTLKGIWSAVAALVLTFVLSQGSAFAQVPDNLIPKGAHEVEETFGIGVQIYHSMPDPSDPTKFVWVFFAPQATLFNPGSKAKIHHFATPDGPGWQSQDGALVVGQVIAKAPSPDANSIPWLLLSGIEHSGNGLLSHVTFIQRIHTRGGAAPGELPTQAGLEVRVPYTATYVFFTGGDK